MGIEDVSSQELPFFRIRYIESEDKPESWFSILTIKDFDYEEDYMYVIKVEEKKIKNPIQDQPEKSYKFLQLISKTKVSDNLD